MQPPPPAAFRIVFGVYAAALLTGTHWPGLAIRSTGVSRLDLVVHAGAFGLWAALFTLGGFLGPALSGKNLALSAAAAAGYAVTDELSQGIPILRRTVDPLDLAANSAGIVLALALLAGWARVRRRGENTR